MILQIFFYVILTIITIFIFLKIKQRFNPNFRKTSPPVSGNNFKNKFIAGFLPFMGDLNLHKPGFRDYVEEKRKELGEIYTVYSVGMYWTFLFKEEDLKVFFNSSEKIISSQTFLEFMLEPFQPFE
jgi:hypothetical protein